MDAATIREDMNGLSSVANMWRKREQHEQDRIDRARRQQQAEDGKRRTTTVAYGLAYTPLFQTYVDQ